MKLFNHRPIPIFPLPSVVLFPRIVQPLHIFEPRYLEMFTEALDSHGQIAMALLKPGYENNYFGSPEIHPVVSVGSIITYEARDDGTYDVVLLGDKRARLEREVGGKIYRRGALNEVEEKSSGSREDRKNLRMNMAALLEVAIQDMKKENKGLALLQKSFAEEPSLGFLVDFLAYHFIKDPEFQQSLLEEMDVSLRARNLLDALTAI
jgi:Lon protease-like protein